MKGILFKPDMIKAIMEGRKTVTRRLGGLEAINVEPDKWVEAKPVEGRYCQNDGSWFINDGISSTWCVQPRYLPGETIYVKETYCAEWDDHTHLRYKFNDPWDGHDINFYDDKGTLIAKKSPWKSPMFMPAKYARTFLQITSVRTERLQDITMQDAIAEGCPIIEAATGLAIQWYKELWDSINKEYKWSDNPWVWVYEFKAVSKP